MKTIFESRVLPDGHLYCPEDLACRKNVRFKVTATFDHPNAVASDQELELSSVHDVSEDFLSGQELSYYLNLKDL